MTSGLEQRLRLLTAGYGRHGSRWVKDEANENRYLRFSCSISLAVYCLYTFFWLIRSLVDPTLAGFIVCGPLQFVILTLFKAHTLIMTPHSRKNKSLNGSTLFRFYDVEGYG